MPISITSLDQLPTQKQMNKMFVLIKELPFSRKPNNLESVTAELDEEDLMFALGDLYNQIPEIPTKLLSDDDDALWQWNEEAEYIQNKTGDLGLGRKNYGLICFILVVGDDRYMVNTEGYDYCRYIAKIKSAK
jgi:hypothetical protein